MSEYSFKKLEVWHLGVDLIKKVYIIALKFPESEKFILGSQIRRAVISVPLNIAEGSGRRSTKEFASFIKIAIGSLLEVVACLDIAEGLGYLPARENATIQEVTKALYFKLVGLRKNLQSR